MSSMEADDAKYGRDGGGGENSMNNKNSILKSQTPNDLVWGNATITLSNKKGEVTKKILDRVWGTAKAGQTTAIMGASGAGKTSLFQVCTHT
jgi:ABC-type multidrug transport system ATPase subunit